ncbi:MAG: hypothetical protein KBT34_09930 [Prevotella sp.]|nr:hypothetical protein [Candidatus Prevotella equi]
MDKDFDPTRLLAGEFAVSTDADTRKQSVYMCFQSGVVKKLVTEDKLSDVNSRIDVTEMRISLHDEILDNVESNMINLNSSIDEIWADYAPFKAATEAALPDAVMQKRYYSTSWKFYEPNVMLTVSTDPYPANATVKIAIKEGMNGILRPLSYYGYEGGIIHSKPAGAGKMYSNVEVVVTKSSTIPPTPVPSNSLLFVEISYKYDMP